MGTASTASVATYLESWGLELTARQNRVRLLIGDAHWLSDGHHKEAILRDFLQRYLPHEVVCSTGFIRGATAEKRCSPEVDILLFSGRVHLPYFSEGGISIVDPASVLATVEVKSSFSAPTLRNALENVKATRTLAAPEKLAASNLWSGLFFYDLPASRTLESCVDTLGENLKVVFDPAADKDRYPTCIVLGQDSVAFPASDGHRVRLRVFERQGWAFASAICDLFASVSSQIDGLRVSGFEEWGSSGDFRVIEKQL